jgi:serine phosphatase RsbU (regulator of sigma subunit)
MRLRLLFPSLCISMLFLGSGAKTAFADAQPSAPVLDIEGLGKGSVALDGPWQFHLGDDMRWAQPDIDDAAGQNGWESIHPSSSWGAQGHYAYSGYGWYRLHLHVTPAPGVHSNLRLLVPGVSDVCEIYWNGVRVGGYGNMPPHPSWPVVNAPAVFALPDSTSGTLAIRVWKEPLGSSSSGYVGGLTGAPLIGDPSSMAGLLGIWNYRLLSATLYTKILDALYFAVAVAAFLLWLRRRSDGLLLWFAIFAICPVLWTAPFHLRLPVSYQTTQFLLQPLFALRNVALWFLLIDLLNLRSHRGLVHWAKILAWIEIAASLLDGLLMYVPAGLMSEITGEGIDAALTLITTLCELYLLVLVGMGFRQKLDKLRWIVALSAVTAQLLVVVIAASQQGQRFTHWTLAQKLSTPLIHIGDLYLNAELIADTLLFLSIIYAVFRYLRDRQARQAILEQELLSARELQQVLIPEKPPSLPDFTISTAYHPALEVGGDFFQVIPLQGEAAGSTLIVLGDVSGKGLRAAMAVSLIVGAVRTLAETTSKPAEILAGLSRRLHGRLQGGFTTCLALRLDADGFCTIASAGHPAPYLNDREISLPGALPLGIDPSTVYEELSIRIAPGDRCSLYTDGLLEARAPSGEIFSFERLQSLFASHADASAATKAAVAFGQDDDITVLTLTRTAKA